MKDPHTKSSKTSFQLHNVEYNGTSLSFDKGRKIGTQKVWKLFPSLITRVSTALKYLFTKGSRLVWRHDVQMPLLLQCLLQIFHIQDSFDQQVQHEEFGAPYSIINSFSHKVNDTEERSACVRENEILTDVYRCKVETKFLFPWLPNTQCLIVETLPRRFAVSK